MTVKTLKKKYDEIQAKSKELCEKLSPLLKEVKKVAKSALKLEELADNDSSLYDENNNMTKGWPIEILFRLGDFSYINDAATSIDTVLRNIEHLPFDIDKSGKK